MAARTNDLRLYLDLIPEPNKVSVGLQDIRVISLVLTQILKNFVISLRFLQDLS